MSEYKRLSESKIEELLLLYIGGASLRSVARRLGVTQATVTWHVKKADIPIRSKASYFEGKPLTAMRRKRVQRA